MGVVQPFLPERKQPNNIVIQQMTIERKKLVKMHVRVNSPIFLLLMTTVTIITNTPPATSMTTTPAAMIMITSRSVRSSGGVTGIVGMEEREGEREEVVGEDRGDVG